MAFLRSHLTYANLISTLALFLAVGGATAIAIDRPPNKSVGAPQLRTGAVTANKLRKNAVTTPKVRAEAITAPKLGTDAVTSRAVLMEAITTPKIAYRAITNDKIALDAVMGEQVVESTLSKVPSAAFADQATSAGSAQPVAFAKVEANGNVVAAESRGVVTGNVKKDGFVGTYCLSVTDFIPRGAQASGEGITTEPVIANVQIPGNCGFPNVEVSTFDFDDGTGRFGKADRAFYAVFYR